MQPNQYNKDDNFVINGQFWLSGLKLHCEYNRYTNEMYQCHYLIIILLKSLLFKREHAFGYVGPTCHL